GETPFAGELIAHRDGISPVLFHYYRTVAANRDLAGLAQLYRVAIPHDRDFMPRIGLSKGFEDRFFEYRAVAYKVIGFGLAEGLVEFHAQLLIYPTSQLGADRLGPAHYTSETQI